MPGQQLLKMPPKTHADQEVALAVDGCSRSHLNPVASKHINLAAAVFQAVSTTTLLRPACRMAQDTDQIALAGGTTPRNLCLCTMRSRYNPSRARSHQWVAAEWESEASGALERASELVAQVWDWASQVASHQSSA